VVNHKKMLVLMVVAAFLFGTAVAGLAFNQCQDDWWTQSCNNYNRPNPHSNGDLGLGGSRTFDYAPQELGIYDTGYKELSETDCRVCHGDSLADTHHMSDTVLEFGQCTPCHDPDPNEPGGVVVTRDCTTAGCHSWPTDIDILTGNGWHHNTGFAAGNACTVCHDENLVAEVGTFLDFQVYPPTVVTPTPYSCENCHWLQDVEPNATAWENGDSQSVSPADGTYTDAGHPSDYYHVDAWGNWVGYYEYQKPIKLNATTHMMEYRSPITAGNCANCHGMDPNNPSWSHTNEELIRYCEKCHSMYTLHSIYGHVGDDFDDQTWWPIKPGPGYPDDAYGWVATGFHVPGENQDDPFDYGVFNCNGSPDADGPDEMCIACHGDNIELAAPTPSCAESDPFVEVLTPRYGTCQDIFTIRGYGFGDEQWSGSKVEFRNQTTSGSWIEVPVISEWTDELLEVRIPCWSGSPTPFTNGRYEVRVTNGLCDLKSNKPRITYGDWLALTNGTGVSPSSGPCACSGGSSWITLTGGNFEDTFLATTYGDYGQTQIIPSGQMAGYGVYRTVEFVSSQFPYTGPLVAKQYKNPAGGLGTDWTNTSIKVRFCEFFVDDETAANEAMFEDGVGRRNHILDPSEQEIPACEGVALGDYSVYVVATYFYDSNGSGTLDLDHTTPGTTEDIIYQVVTSDPEPFRLTNTPFITKVVPNKSEPKQFVRIVGGNFNTSQAAGYEVRLGKKSDYNNNPFTDGKLISEFPANPARKWTMTKIRVKLKPCPSGWAGKTRYLWVIADGMVSNKSKIRILAP